MELAPLDSNRQTEARILLAAAHTGANSNFPPQEPILTEAEVQELWNDVAPNLGSKEADPNGIAQNAPGAKLDAGKADVGLVFESFPNALMAVAEVATFGANKYTRGGWKDVPGGLNRYAAAGGRHMLKRYAGECADKDSKLPHRFHEVWNALAQLEFELTGKKDQ